MPFYAFKSCLDRFSICFRDQQPKILSFMTYGTKLRNIRLQKGLSKAEVANAIGLDQSTYSHIESDLSEPKANILNDAR